MQRIEIKTKSKSDKSGEHHKPKNNLRKIRLDLPESSILNKNTSPKPSESAEQDKDSPENYQVVIYSPSLLFKLDKAPIFFHEVALPSSSFPFIATPGPGLSNPRFFVYTVPSKGSSPINVQISVNNNSCRHITADENPIDFTDALNPFGKESVITIETDAFVVPFSVVGIWASEKSLSELINECAVQNSFIPFSSNDICPITKMAVTVAGKGKECTHVETFDAPAFIGRGIATGDWQCPICGRMIPIEELCIGSTQSEVNDILDTTFDPNEWTQ